MLRELPHRWNWQTAFLPAFGFERLLDAEKWWELAVISFKARDPFLSRTPQACLDALDQILTVSANLAISTNTLPTRTEAGIAQIISEFDYESHKPLLQARAIQLSRLIVNAPPMLRPLIGSYRECLQTYLQRRGDDGRQSNGKIEVVIPPSMLIRQTVERLEELDAQRAALQSEPALLNYNPLALEASGP